MRVLFHESDTERDWAGASLGPAFIASRIRQSGHEVRMIRVPPGQSPDRTIAAIRDASPGLIGVSLTTRQWRRARAVLASIRDTLGVPVVAGGLHPSFLPEQTLEARGIDYVCLGEGEEAMLDLIGALEAKPTVTDGQIRNIWVKGGTQPAMRPPFEPIDALPFMARDLLDERHGVVHLTTQRGCPFPCAHCGARSYDDLYRTVGRYGRRRSLDSVLEELETIRRQGELNYVIFLDDTFTIHRGWVLEFCRVYGERLAVPFFVHARVETVSPEMIQALAAAGCRHITYGVESGSERVRREIMQRPVAEARIVDAFAWTRDAGILVTANYMMGLPGETREEMEETFRLHERLAPADFGYFVFYPYPGTRLFRLCRERGYLPENFLDLPADHSRTVLDLPDLTAGDIEEVYGRWTEIRTARALRMSGGSLSEEDREGIARTVRKCADLG